MAKVIVLCGRIASGKTYYANQLKSRTNAIILSVDDLMLNLSDSCLGDRHDDVAIRCERYLYGLAEQLIKSKIEVIIDFGYWLKTERVEAKQYFKDREIDVELHYLNTPEDIRRDRLKVRNDGLNTNSKGRPNDRVYLIGEELRKRLDLKFEEPSSDEIDRIIS